MADPERGRGGGGGNKNACLCFCLVLAILIIVLLLIILFIALLVGAKGCSSSECVDLAADLMAPMNRSADPCEDFYEYACGNWDEQVPMYMRDGDRSMWHARNHAQTAARAKLLEALDDDDGDETVCPRRGPPSVTARAPGRTTRAPVTTKGPSMSAINKAKKYFTVCKDCPMDDSDARHALNWLIEELGSWELTGRGIDQSNWKMGKAFGLAHRYVNGPFFAIKGAEHFTRQGNTHNRKRGYRFHPALTTGFPPMFDDADLKELDVRALNEVAGLVGVKSSSIDVRRSAEEIWEVYKQIPQMAQRCDPDEIKSMRSFAADLGGEFDLGQYWRALTGEGNLPNVNVTISCPNYFRQLKTLYQRTDLRANEKLSNAVVWSVLKDFLNELRPHFWERTFQSVARLTHIEKVERWEQCVESTGERFPGPIGSLYVDAALDKDDEEEIAEMARHVSDAVEAGWKEAPKKLQNIIQAEKKTLASIALTAQFNDTAAMDQEYGDYAVGDDPFDNLVAAKKKHLEREREDPHTSRSRPDYEYRYGMYHMDFDGDVLDIGGAFLESPYYVSKGASAVNYGALGSELAGEFVAPVVRALRDADASAFNRHSDQLLDQRKHLGLAQRRITYKPTAIFGRIGALRVAYDAYTEWMESNDDTAYMAGLELSNEQVFFLSYAQSKCSWSGMDEDKRNNAILTGSEELALTLANSAEFAEAYHCPEKDGSLNPPSANVSRWDPFLFHFSSGQA